MPEQLLTLASVDSWTLRGDGSVDVTGVLTTNKQATPMIAKVISWMRTATRTALAQFNLDQQLGSLTVNGNELTAHVTDARAIPLVKRGAFHAFQAVVDVLTGECLAVSLVDRASVKSAGSTTSVLLYKRLQVDERAEFAQRIAATRGDTVGKPDVLLYEREDARQQTEADQAWLRRHYGMKEAKPKPIKDPASKAEIKRVRQNYKRMGGELGKAYKNQH